MEAAEAKQLPLPQIAGKHDGHDVLTSEASQSKPRGGRSTVRRRRCSLTESPLLSGAKGYAASNTKRVTSGGAPTRAGGPTVPMPRLT